VLNWTMNSIAVSTELFYLLYNFCCGFKYGFKNASS
jgi:hypothetical protein